MTAPDARQQPGVAEALDAFKETVRRTVHDYEAHGRLVTVDWQLGVLLDAARHLLATAEPLITAEAIRSATREQFEDAIRTGADEVTRARLAEIEATVRADQRERDAQLADRVGATYPAPGDEAMWDAPFGERLRAQP